MKILPLRSKYYGTEVVVDDMGPLHGLRIELWHNTGNPSDRQLEQWGLTRQQWDADEMVEDCWGVKSRVSQMDYTCDGHYESKETYELAKKICEIK